MKGNYFSVRDAAQRVGISRQTMFRYIKDGKISATSDRDGQKQIELTELLRVFGELQPETETPATPRNSPRPVSRDTATAPVTSQYQMEILRLQAQLEIKTAELDLAKERINELKVAQHEASVEKNRFLEIIERQSLLLAAPKPARTRTTTPAKKTPTARAAATPKKTVSTPPKANRSASSKVTTTTKPKQGQVAKASKAGASKASKAINTSKTSKPIKDIKPKKKRS